MTYLLDTNTCAKYLNGRSDNIRLNLESRNSVDIVLCSVGKTELYYGAMKSQHPEKTLMRLNQFLERFISLPFDDDKSKTYGEIRAQLEKKGTPIGPNDL